MLITSMRSHSIEVLSHITVDNDNSQDRDVLRERERQARARAQLVDQNMLVEDKSSQPIFGDPIKIDPNKEDETSRRVKQTLGDFTHVQQYLTQDPKHLIGISLTAAALSSQLCPTPDTSTTLGGFNNNQQHANSPKVHTCSSNDPGTVSSCVTSTAGSHFVVKKESKHPKKPQIFNGQYKDDSTIGCQKSPVTGGQVKVVTMKQPKVVLSQCVISDFQPKLLTVPDTEKEIESVVVSNKEAANDSQPVSVKAEDERLHEKTNTFHEICISNGSIHLANQNKSSKDEGIHKKINAQQGEICVKSHSEVEHILKEMKQPVPPPLTAIETPRKEEPEFSLFSFKEKPEVGASESSSVQEKGDTVEKPLDRNESTSFNFRGDLDVSDSENEMVTFQDKEGVKQDLNSRLSQNGNHCPSTPERESSSSDSSSSSSEESTSDSEDSDSSGSSDDSIAEREKPETQSWRLSNFVDKDASSPLIPFGNVSTGEQNKKSQIITDQISDQDSHSNTPVEKSNEGHRSSSAELRMAAGLGNAEVRILLSPVHLPPGFQPEDSMFINNSPFSSYSKQWEDDGEMGQLDNNWSEVADSEKRVCPSQLKKGIHPSLKENVNVEGLNSGFASQKRSAQKLTSRKKDFKECFLPSPTQANKSEQQSDDISAIKGYDLIKKPLSSKPCDGVVKHNVGKKKERTLSSTNSALERSRNKEENKNFYLKTSKVEVKHKRDLISNLTPKLLVNDSEKPTSSKCPNEKTTARKLTPKYVSDTSNITENNDNTVRITSPVKVQKTNKHLSTSKSSISQKSRSLSPKQITTTKKAALKYKSGRLKEKHESSITSNVLKVIDSVAKHATVTSHSELEDLDVDRTEVSQKNLEDNNIFKRLELPFSQGNFSPLMETVFEFQNEQKHNIIPEILVSIKLNLINRIPSAPLQFQLNRTYSSLDSDVKLRTENDYQDITKENNVIKGLEVKKEDLKTAIGNDKACTKDKSISTSKLKPSDKDKVKTFKRKAPEETRIEGKKKKVSSDTASVALVLEVDNIERLTMKESKKIEDNTKIISSEHCESPSSFSVCSVSSQYSVKSSQETLTSKPSGNKTKDKGVEKIKQKLKDENKMKSKTPTPSHAYEKDANLGNNKKEPEEKKRAKEKKEKEQSNKEKERSRLKDKEQDHGSSDSKRPRKSAIVEKSLLSSSQVGKPTTEKPCNNLKRDHEPRLQGKEATPNSYSELDHTVPDQLATNRLGVVPEDQDTRQSSPDYYLNEAKNLKHQADREVDITVQAVKYLEAVYFFILTGNAMEHSHVESERVYKMFKETLDLIRCIWSKFQKMQQNSCNLDKRITVLSLRCQSLLYYKLYRLKRGEIREAHKSLNEYHKSVSGRWPSHQSPLSSSNLTPNPNCRLSQPSPCQPRNYSGTTMNGVASPHSPTPSPAGSVASVGSQSSGYISCELNGAALLGSQNRSGNGTCNTTTPQAASSSSHASSLRPSGGSGPSSSQQSSTAIPQHVCSLLQKQNTHLTNLHMCHELWDQAQYLIVHSNSKDFFSELDASCGRLTLDSSFMELVQYVQAGLSKLKETS
ncbi:uncharacterized protein LOC143244340 isoform X2 [Tachypleus tridentatus]|uniref:uncharacterized protein LOC143244340 isoform X2 n=1 Tax=Tachypleus tridentatus TaxID=6853 RepID=UPI003FD103B3